MALLLEHEFKPLPADKQIETLPFLEAVAHLPPFFDCLGTPIVYSPVKADLTGNIKVGRDSRGLREESPWGEMLWDWRCFKRLFFPREL
uniref:Glycolipid transfer protein domain-containing protein n=1 Tax=Cyanoderma ruficeps TaxID=181631 RepID=A0A8C3P303_9PASS